VSAPLRKAYYVVLVSSLGDEVMTVLEAEASATQTGEILGLYTDLSPKSAEST
jgi:hypothetical protein